MRSLLNVWIVRKHIFIYSYLLLFYRKWINSVKTTLTGVIFVYLTSANKSRSVRIIIWFFLPVADVHQKFFRVSAAARVWTCISELFASFVKMIKCYLIQSVIKNVLLSNLGRRSVLILCFIVSCATNQWPVCVCVCVCVWVYVYWLVSTALPGVYLSADTFFDGAIASQPRKTHSEKTSQVWSRDQTRRPDSKMVLIQARELEVGGLGGGRSRWSLIAALVNEVTAGQILIIVINQGDS